MAFHVPLQFAELVEDGNITWVHAAPWDRWDHPMYGETVFPRERGERMKQNFENNVREIEIATDYEHGLDRAKGTKASGWVRKVDPRDDGLWLGIQFTETAKKEIADGEWKYFSYEFNDEWEHPRTGMKYEDVLAGGGLTNKPWIKGVMPINFSELVEEVRMDDDNKPKGEVADKEHSEPGSGTPPIPRTDEPAGKDHEPGTREASPPVEPEDTKVNDLEAKLRKELNLDPDEDIIKVVTGMKAEVEPLREAAKAHSESKAFAEQFPEEYARMQRLEKSERGRDAKAFAERYARITVEDEEGTKTDTGFGFSALVLSKLEDVHKKFSEGTVTIADIGETLDLMAKKGIVQYSETGASIVREDEDDNVPAKGAAQKFSEKVTEAITNDKLDYKTAVAAVTKQNPELFEAYRAEMEAGRK